MGQGLGSGAQCRALGALSVEFKIAICLLAQKSTGSTEEGEVKSAAAGHEGFLEEVAQELSLERGGWVSRQTGGRGKGHSRHREQHEQRHGGVRGHSPRGKPRVMLQLGAQSRRWWRSEE